MAEKSKQEQLRAVIAETSGAAMTLSPNDEGWGGYLLQKKKKFEASSCDELCEKMMTFISEKREKVEVTKKQKKPFKL